MDAKVKGMIRGWLEMHHGDREGLAKWMRDSLKIGGIKACREIIEEYDALEFSQREYERQISA